MKFVCSVIGFNGPRTGTREADSAEAAAEQCAKAMHTAYWSQAYRSGHDPSGPYQEFTIHQGNRPVATVRVHS